MVALTAQDGTVLTDASKNELAGASAEKKPITISFDAATVPALKELMDAPEGASLKIFAEEKLTATGYTIPEAQKKKEITLTKDASGNITAAPNEVSFVNQKSGASVSVQEFANLNEAFDALDAGTVDYVLCDAYSGAYLAAIHPGIACAGTINDPSAIGIGVASGNAELQTAVQGALEAISTNGVMGIVRSRWIGSMGNLSGESRVQGLSS